MKKLAVILFSIAILASGASAALIPQNITVDFNIGLDNDDKDEKVEKENNTYGQRVEGQSVYKEQGPNDPPEKRNSEEYRITEEDPRADDGFFSRLMRSLNNLF